jgi:hypothetical protein
MTDRNFTESTPSSMNAIIERERKLVVHIKALERRLAGVKLERDEIEHAQSQS